MFPVSHVSQKFQEIKREKAEGKNTPPGVRVPGLSALRGTGSEGMEEGGPWLAPPTLRRHGPQAEGKGRAAAGSKPAVCSVPAVRTRGLPPTISQPPHERAQRALS